ncbi:solute carrier family 22 member 4 [Leptinotarsa decemlineata]|uniref:solute carrier family 22 member 4 n=1 Tax=Leptinotarsa decemlineata TaxID=7539 RepID=UPI003D30981B
MTTLQYLLNMCSRNVCSKFPLCECVLLAFVIVFSTFPLSFIFTARDVKYRCFIPECENITETTYNPEWLKDFVPFQHELPSSCYRYALSNDGTCSRHNTVLNETIRCDKFIFQREEITIVHDFGIFCEDNLWKLTIIGTLSGIGEIVCFSYAGFISDRYGRGKLIILSVSMSSMISIVRSFSTNYTMYAFLEFFDTVFCAAMFGASLVLVMELVSPKQRDIANLLICFFYTIGQWIVGVTAWLSPSWRMMIRVLHIPGLMILLLFFAIPETRTLVFLTYKRNRAKEIVPEEEGLNEMKDTGTITKDQVEEVELQGFWDVMKEKVLLLRAIRCSLLWIGSNFLYYGLTLYSVTISEDIYVNFVLSVAIDIPAILTYYYGSQKFRRRWTMLVAFMTTGVCCLCVGFIEEELYWTRLLIFLLGKCGAAVVFTLIFVFTTELFPTSSRHSILSLCSMIGKIGSLLAPQLPLLARMNHAAPLMIFGIIAVTAGILSLFFPETVDTKLPETIEEAVNMGNISVDNNKIKI